MKIVLKKFHKHVKVGTRVKVLESVSPFVRKNWSKVSEINPDRSLIRLEHCSRAFEPKHVSNFSNI